MDVLLPSGVKLQGIPEGLSDEDIKLGAINQGIATESDFFPAIDRKKVMTDWNSFDSEVESMPDNEKRTKSVEGKVASLFTSGGADFENVQNNIDTYSQSYLGDEKATPQAVHGLFNAKVLNIRDMEHQDNILDSIIDDLSEDTGIDYGYVKMSGEEKTGLIEKQYPERKVIMGGKEVTLQPETVFFPITLKEAFAKSSQEFLALPEEERTRLFEEAFIDSTPGARFSVRFAQQYIPEWMLEEIYVTEADSAADYFQELSGSIGGVIASFATAGTVLHALGGVRTIPKVGTMLNKIALKSPRASRLVEQSLNSFAVFASRDQIHMDGNLVERVERMGEDAMISIAFPVAHQIALIPKVGVPLGLGTVAAVGASGKDKTPTDRAIGATVLSMAFLIGRGISYNKAKKDVTKFVKSSGIERNILKPNGKDAEWFVEGFDKNSIHRTADNLYNMAQKNRAVADMAQSGIAKVAKGQQPTPAEKLAIAKMNETEVVSMAKQGEMIPIRGDRAVQQFDSTKDLIRSELEPEEVETQEPATEAPPVEGEQAEGATVAQEDGGALERTMMDDVDDFGIPPEQAIENMGRIPAQDFEREMHYNDSLPNIIPPQGPTDADLTTTEGNEWLNVKAKALRRMTENLFGIFRKFGKQYVSDKTLAEKLEESYHKIAAQPHFAVLDIHRKLQQYPRTSRQDRTALTVALESDNPSNLSDRLIPIYAELQQIYAEIEGMQIDAGVLTQTFEETQTQRIADIDRKITEAKGKQKDVLKEEKQRLEDIKKYVPHNKVAQNVMEEKAANSPIGMRRSFGKKLSQFHKQRKGTHSLEEYLEQGIITENDMDVVNLAMGAYASAYHKIAVRGLMEWGKNNGYIIPANTFVENPEEWFAEDELHPIARVGGLKDMKVNRLFAQGLEELGGKDGQAYNWWDKALAITKVGAFYNPFIIGKHNISQAVLGGSAGVKNAPKAFQIVSTKNDLWRQFDEAGLYQKTDIPTRVAVDELIQQMSNKTKQYATDNISKMVNTLSGFFRTTPEELQKILENKSIKKALEKAVMGPSMITSGVTWWLDEFQRTNSALNLMDKGYTAQEAAKEAARIHVAYSNIGDQYKKYARKILFVHAFRMLMPYELFLRPYIDIADQIYKGATGKKVSDKKLKKAAYVLLATVGLPALFDAYMKLHGWDVAEEERESGIRKLADKATVKIPLWNGETMDITPAALPHWKYTKQIDTIDGPKEIVSTVGTPNVILTRMGVRLTQQFPEAPGKEKSKQIWNMARSEINPLYENLYNFFQNEPLSYGEEPPMGIDGKDLVGGVDAYFKQTFKAWAFILESVSNGLIKKDEASMMLKENLDEFEKAMRLYNFAYIRSAPEKRKTALKFELLDAAKEGAWQIRSLKIPDEEKEKRIEEWRALIIDSANRIDGESD